MMSTLAIPVDRMLSQLCRVEDCKFTVFGEAIEPSALFDPSMVLPFLAMYVGISGKELKNIDFGCKFLSDKNSLLGTSVAVPGVSGNLADVVRGLFFIHYATETFGIKKNAVVEVGPLLESIRAEFSSLLEQASLIPEAPNKSPEPIKQI